MVRLFFWPSAAAKFSGGEKTADRAPGVAALLFQI